MKHWMLQGTDVDSPCPEHDNGTALHIAAANLSLGAARVLLAYGADPEIRDDLARMPIGELLIDRKITYKILNNLRLFVRPK